MPLSEQDNRKLTQVGPGTPGGEMLRRYWHPIGGLHQVTEETPTSHVRLLGEDLVLFRDRSGRVGLLADHCAHRGASLLYGRVEERGIACAYHGWLYDVNGNCLECPAEPADSHFCLTVKQRAYPVERMLGLYWAYLGPSPTPPIRKLDVCAYPVQRIMEMGFDANWVQVLENNLDGAHIPILHQDTATSRPQATGGTTRGGIDELVSLDYEEAPSGLLRKMLTSDGYLQEDLLVFPNMLRRMVELSIKVPVDDQRTRKYVIYIDVDRTRGVDDEPVDYWVMPPGEGKNGTGSYPVVGYRMDRLRFQDIMAIETQGTVTARHNWRPGTSDRGILLFHELLFREMDRAQRDEDPLGVVRDPAHVVDTNFEALRHTGYMHVPPPQGVQVYARPERVAAG
jgi:5,5'-dehydrodivanillate O-demethylase